jgi:hypothetical protein
MEKRSAQVIHQEMKASVSKLLEAMKRTELAHRDMVLAIVEILNLQKELERNAVD